VSLKGFLVEMFALVTLILQSSCALSNDRPDVDLTIWAGSSSKAAIERRQDNLIIECNDPAFNSYACMEYDQLKQLEEDVFEGCEVWK
jgi:hypothetical protein